jgi:para-nitrobenzyl esterase
LNTFAFRLSLLAGLVLAPPALAGEAPVRIDSGLVSGTSTAVPAVRAYRGIPYAAAPIGDLRWRAPAQVQPWPGVRAADHPGNICPQLPPTDKSAETGIAGLTIAEDCLNLDVWTGARKPGEHRAVMVWFHGGGRGAGAGSQPLFNGAALAKKGVVVVTVNYRGGPLGLLATPALSQENDHHASGNYGLLDDIAALKWVQRNIAAFGGDPANVTIFGQSFGSGSAHFLSLSPLAEGLFHRMINESHALYPRDPTLMKVATKYMLLKDAEADGQTFMQMAGATSLAQMRAMPWQQLVQVFDKSTSSLLWTYVIDGYVLPRNFSASYAAGTQADVDEMGGENHDENGAAPDSALALVAAGKAKKPSSTAFLGAAAYRQYVIKRFGPMADEFLKLYPADTDAQAFASANASIRDNQRISPWMWAGVFTKNRTKPVYLYFFTKAPPGPNHDLTGVYHGADLRYAFDNPTPAWGAQDRHLADIMSSYWTNFAKSGNPNAPGLPDWAAFDVGKEQTMELGAHLGPIPLADPVRLDFWRRFYATQPAH